MPHRKLADVVRNNSKRTESFTDETIDEILEEFIFTSYESPPNDNIELITLFSDGRRGGESIKIENISLRWSKLLRAIPGMTLTVAGLNAEPWLIILAALAVWNEVRKQKRVELNVKHAGALMAIWQLTRKSASIREEEARDQANRLLEDWNENRLDTATFAATINDLDNFGCIRLKDGKIRLIEEMKI